MTTLNNQNLKEVFSEVDNGMWDLIGRQLRLPKSKRDQIKSAFKNDSEKKEAILHSYATDHPYPNWPHVVDILRGMDYAKQANEVSAKYLSISKSDGVKCINFCILLFFCRWHLYSNMHGYHPNLGAFSDLCNFFGLFRGTFEDVNYF